MVNSTAGGCHRRAMSAVEIMRGFPTDKFDSDWLASTHWPHCPRWLRCDPGTGTRAGLQAHAIAPPSLPTPFLWGDGNGNGGLRAQLSDEANHHPVVGHRLKGRVP